jgi:hypothetical protein
MCQQTGRVERPMRANLEVFDKREMNVDPKAQDEGRATRASNVRLGNTCSYPSFLRYKIR